MSEAEEIILEETERKKVNVKAVSVLFYRGIPYYRFEAVNGKKGYSYDIDKGMYPTLTTMLDALIEEGKDADTED